MTAEICTLPIERLHPHPDNPRLQMREDVVERLTAEIGRSGFGAEHAILVRPLGDDWEIVSGHHRLEAARRAGLPEVPAWVRDLDDDEAFMQLVLGNTQGELSPLEIGMHAYKAVSLSAGGRGNVGGLAEYAERLGRDKSGLTQLRAAASVALTVETSQRLEVMDKAYHLYEISKAPRETWPLLTSAMLRNQWPVTVTASFVAKIREFNIPDEYRHWLRLGRIVQRFLNAPERFTPRTVARIVETARGVHAWLDAAGTTEQRVAFDAWLVEHAGAESWDPRAITARHQEMLAANAEPVAGWHHGSWEEVVDQLEDATVALLLTDPPYGMRYQSGYRTEKHEEIVGDGVEAFDELAKMLAAFTQKLTDDAQVLVFCSPRGEPAVRDVLEAAGLTLRSYPIWDKQATGMGDLRGTFAPAHERIVHAAKGTPELYRRISDVLRHARADSARHPTEKPVPLLAELIEATTARGELVADPYGGVASTCVAAKETGRRWWGAEINETYWTIGEERLLT